MGATTFDFEDEMVVVTGGSSGIGRAIAERFGEAGATVLIADVQEAPRDAGEDAPTHEAIRDGGGEARFVETDVSNSAQIASVLEAAHEFGGVDVMVNNAGIYLSESLTDIDLDDLDRVLSVNVRGLFVGCQHAARDMLERDSPGSILNTASISSRMAQHGQIAYDASKGAVKMITRGAALELGEAGIRVNAVAPGHIATAFGSGGSSGTEDAVENDSVIKPVPLGRAGYPEDIAGPALFLASEDASYVTGELLFVDGGLVTC